jgi:DNA helicase-2/ATP-dependent DNA helicase PcrA
MKHFADSYSNDLLTVVLTNNYRSVQPILDVSKTLINRNEERLVKKIPNLSKELIASREHLKNLHHQPRIKIYETQRQEMIDITLQIQQLLQQGTPPGKIAVIYKENKYGEELTAYFKQLAIPVYSKRNLNVFELPLAQKMILLLRYLAAELDAPYGGDEMLFELLHTDWFGIPPVEIAKLTVQVSQTKFPDGPASLRRLLVEKSKEQPKDLFSTTLHPGLSKAATITEQLLTDASGNTLQHLIESIIRKTGLLQHIMQAPDKHWQLQILTAFFDFVKEETRRNPLLSLQQLVGIIDLMEKEDIALPLVQVSGSDKGVNLLTAHGSKGLEFEYVFFAGCNAGFWEKKRKPGGGYKLPDTMFVTQTKQSDEEELRRLFYVALTRAEQHLFISYSKFKNDGKELEPSMFLAEIQEVHELKEETVLLSAEALSAFAAMQFGEAAAPEIDKIEEEFIGALLERFTMNVTALNNYLDCPLGFYFKNLIRIPSPKNEATEFGSAVHYALEQLFRKMQEGGKETFPSKDEFINDFVWYMQRHRESFTKEQYNRRMEYGQEVLSNYYNHSINSFNKIVAIERNISKVLVKGVPLKGKLDKLEFDGKAVNVVDYKTGDVDKAREKMKGPNDKEPNGGDYWRQAVFYKILVDNYELKDWKVVSTEFDFVEPNKKKEYKKEKIVITPADIETVTQQITTVWNKIQNREFYIGCGKEDCHWCNFVKTNNMAISLHELEEEETES